jgi:hypothetical protein
MKAPHLHESLRRFCLGAFAVFSADIDAGADVPFAFEEHGTYGRPTLYEYRPLVRGFVEARAERLATREDARMALEDLRREPAAKIFARAHAGPRPDEDAALFKSVLVPLLVRTAEGCGGFDWDDVAYDGAYRELASSLFGDGHGYGAVAPLVGLSIGETIELGAGIRVRSSATGELAAHWPEANGLLPPGFGAEPDRLCVLELERSLVKGDAEPPDATAELADAVTALRLATEGGIAAGPVIFERLDWRPYGIRPMLPIAATPPAADPTRLDRFRAGVAAELLPRLGSVEDDRALAEALDRWELALFQAEPFRSEQVKLSLVAALGGEDGLWAASIRAAALLGESPTDRARVLASLEDPATVAAAGAVRRMLVELLLRGDREQLIAGLDETLLGLRPAQPVRLDATRRARAS